MGVDPASITDVIITHMHYDHCGNHHLFGGARFHLQDREIAYATGRCMCFKPMREAYDEEDVVAMVRRVHRGKAVFHDGDEEIAPGLSVHRIGGHTMGLQSLRIHTRKGWLVLASDAAHLYANMEQSRPFPIVYNVADMLEGHQRLYRLASSPDLVIPGHDPLVMQRYPSPSAELEGRVVRLD
ncbi:MAG: N-acyl homoserine lactonase family protein [Betaproteobacteria bacterium]|jgi:glyoxylase-like metal-dependent hydrolase (beta-lactamase superfamily II)|nr:N-acyl homoserine lactonase family protein [Betaproteobacteria bacterium]